MKKFPLDERYEVTDQGEVFFKGVKCNFKDQPKGYKRIYIRGMGRDVGVHRVVAITYLDNPEDKPTVNHINGVKDDNRLINLEWATYQEQSDHSHSTGLYWVPQGESAHQATMTDQQVVDICELFMDGLMPKTVSEMMDLPLSRVADIKRQKSYKNITLKYDFPKRFTKSKKK